MKKLFSYILPVFALFSLVFVTACDKDEEPTNTATIEISSPTEGQIIMGGATVDIKATLTGTEMLHGWKLEIRKVADDTVLYTAEAHDHGMSYTINETWTNNVTHHSDLVLEVFAQVTHEGEWQSKTVHFHAHPM